MNLLAAKLYDPAAAVSKSTASLLAMTAFDTTNLRLAITVPAHGMVLFKLRTTITGATTVPTVFLGVMNGSTVLGRVTPQDFPGTMNAATQSCPCQCEFVVTGLTPGAMNVDAAYGVEVVVASTNIKYGGPNNTTTNDAWGAFVFEAWEPQSQTANSTLAVDSSGRVDVSKVAGTTQTARDLGAQLDATVSSRMATYTQPTGFLAATFPAGTVANTTNITAGTITTVTNLTNAPTAGDFTATMKTSLNAATPASVTGAVGSVTGAVGSVTGNVGGNVVGSVASVTAAVTLPSIPANWITAAGINAGALNGKGDWNIGKTGYSLTATTGLGNQTANITGNLSGSVGSVVGLTASNLDATVSSRLASASYTAPDNTSITAIKAKTDSLNFTVAGKLDANILYVNGVLVNGDGAATPWGP